MESLPWYSNVPIHWDLFKWAIYGITVLAYAVYVSYSIYLSVENSILIIILSATIVVCSVWKLFGDVIISCCLRHHSNVLLRRLSAIRISVWSLGLAAMVIYVVVIAVQRNNAQQLIGLAGVISLLLICLMGSTNFREVSWECVVSGVALQFLLGLLVFRLPDVSDALRWLGDQIAGFLKFANYGSEFVFGEKYREHSFAFEIMPMLIFFGSVAYALQYLGVMQKVVVVIGYFVSFITGISPVEAFFAVANIFLSLNEPFLMVRSMVPSMTLSELHCAIASGLGTINGGLIAVYISFGIPSQHLLLAALMAAPANVVVANLLLPESKDVNRRTLELHNLEANNIFDAFRRGAESVISVAAEVVTMLIAFISVVEFVNVTLAWFGQRVGIDITFQTVCAYIFTPVAFLMGIEWGDCFKAAELIGIKVVINEYVAFSDLATLIENRKQGLTPAITERSEVIVTYALSGFENLATLGSMIGFISSIAPSRRGDMAQVALRSLLAGLIGSFMTGCVASLLYLE